jgi:hypothetical protein
VSQVFGKESFKSIIQKFITKIDNRTYLNGDENRILYLNNLLTVGSSSISGIIHKGYSGHETYIDAIEKNKAKTINKITREQFNSMPFYFLIAKPEFSSKGFVFIAQSYKQFGFKEVFEDAFREFSNDLLNNEYICEFNTLSLASLFQKYINDGNIKKMRFRKHGLTANIENLLNEKANDSEDYAMELSLIARKKGFLGIKEKIKFSDSKNDSSFIEIFKMDDFKYEEAYADVSIGGRKRVLNITNPDDFSASFDITNKININKVTNHPDFKGVDIEAHSILKNEIIPNFKS